ncbi:hypothetical protein NJB1604_51150 [Mycobacterium marinum]|nr:hypothetical protein NJB1604_51150 [Mycobacterium marinum]
MWASARRIFANVIASAWSDFARATECRSWYRATARGLIANTGRREVRRVATINPRGVSIAIGIGPSAVSPTSASITVSSAKPVGSSAILRLATSLPPVSVIAMS